MRNKENEAPLPDDTVLHGINSLAIQLPNKTRIFIIPS